jgi:hypothetical protein
MHRPHALPTNLQRDGGLAQTLTLKTLTLTLPNPNPKNPNPDPTQTLKTDLQRDGGLADARGRLGRHSGDGGVVDQHLPGWGA